MRRRGTAALAVGLVLGGCGPDVAAGLRREIAELEESRMPRDALEKMRGEADDAERHAGALAAEAEALRDGVGGLAAETARLESELQSEIARNEALRARIEVGREALVALAARRMTLGEEVVRQRARAKTLADQADALARELRPEDPPWARELRLATLREFLGDVAAPPPHDPEIRQLAAVPLPEDTADAMRIGAALVASLRDRVRELYGIEEDAAPGADDAEPDAGGAAPSGSEVDVTRREQSP